MISTPATVSVLEIISARVKISVLEKISVRVRISAREEISARIREVPEAFDLAAEAGTSGRVRASTPLECQDRISSEWKVLPVEASEAAVLVLEVEAEVILRPPTTSSLIRNTFRSEDGSSPSPKTLETLAAAVASLARISAARIAVRETGVAAGAEVQVRPGVEEIITKDRPEFRDLRANLNLRRNSVAEGKLAKFVESPLVI